MECREPEPRHCRELAARISAYLDGELDASGRREVEEHLGACRKCACCLETLRRTIDLCRRAAPQLAPEEFSRRLVRLLERLDPAPAGRRRKTVPSRVPPPSPSPRRRG